MLRMFVGAGLDLVHCLAELLAMDRKKAADSPLAHHA